MEDLLQVGAITQTHGVHGEVKVFPMTDDVNRFKKKKDYIIETKKGNIEVKVTSAKFFKQFVILKFDGYDSIESVESYKGCGLFVTRKNAVSLAKDEFFIADLIDLKVIDEEEKPFGTVKDVLQTGANDVYVVETEDGKEVLLPAIKECILQIDMDSRVMKIHIMPGLLED